MNTGDATAILIAAIKAAEVETVGELMDYCRDHDTTPQTLASSS